MDSFTKGQRVTVSYTGNVEDDWLMGCFSVRDGDGRTHNYLKDSKNVTLTVTDPEGYPVRLGDIWELDGTEFFAAKYHKYDATLTFFPSADEGFNNGHSFLVTSTLGDKFKRTGPVLVRRQ